MSTPEIISEQPMQPEITQKVEQPIIPERQEPLGVTAPAQTPKPLVGDNNQVLVQPVPAAPSDLGQVLAVPTTVALDEKSLEKGAIGPTNLAITWLDMYWLRQVGKALAKGWKVIFGQKT